VETEGEVCLPVPRFEYTLQESNGTLKNDLKTFETMFDSNGGTITIKMPAEKN
jgi:hypothetical protein